MEPNRTEKEALSTIRGALPALQDERFRTILSNALTHWETSTNEAPPTFIGAASDGITDGRLAAQLRDYEQTTYDAQLTPICVLDLFSALIMNADQMRFDLDSYTPLLVHGDASLGVSVHSQTPVLQLVINGIPVAIRMSHDRLAALGTAIDKHLGRGEPKH